MIEIQGEDAEMEDTVIHAEDSEVQEKASLPDSSVEPEVSTDISSQSAARLIVVHLAISPELGGPLRGVCIDLDIGQGLGDITGVSH